MSISREQAEFEARKTAIRNRRLEQKRREQKAMLKRVLALFSIAAVLTVAVLSVTVFFPIKTIAVEGKTKYTPKQIIDASGIKTGQNLWLGGTSAEENITKKLPYISVVTVKRKFPSKIVLSVKSGEAEFCYKTKEGYLICDSNDKLLEISKQKPKKLLQVIGSTAKKTAVGDIVAFEKKEKYDLINKIKTALTNKKINVSMIDVTDSLDIFLNIDDGRLNVTFGSSGNIDSKVAHLAEMVLKIDKKLKGTIDLSYWSAENPKGIFTQK